ncbi:dCTP deaminase [[Eubacterium] cellulosolvens]
MALSDVTIKSLIKQGEIEIIPFEESHLTPAGYDLGSAEEVTLKPSECRLIATREKVKLSPKILGILHIRSSFAREGLFASLALVDPGFKGQLTIALLNAGKNNLRINLGESFLQLSLIQMTSGVEKPYDGVYQDSAGIVESKREVYARKK